MGKYGVAKVVWPVVENAVEMVDTCAWNGEGSKWYVWGRWGWGDRGFVRELARASERGSIRRFRVVVR